MRVSGLLFALALLAVPSATLAQTHNDGGTQAAKIAAERGYPLPQGKPVVDAANVIPDDQEAALVSKILAYENRTKHQLVVTTVKSLNGEDVEQYSVTYFRAVGIGGADRDDGTLILVSPSEHKGWITTGRGMETILTDAQASDIWHDTIVPRFKDGDIPGGIIAGADEVMKRTTPLTAAELAIQQRETARENARSAAAWAKFWDFLTTLAFGALGGAIFGIYWKVTGPARKRRREEREAAEQAAFLKQQAEERARQAEFARQERERIAEAKRKRDAMLAAMTPSQRQAFLDKERRDAEAAAAAAAAAEAARAARAAEQRRRDEESSSYSSSYGSSSSWSDSSSSSDSGWSGGGGDTGGGGAGGSW